LLSGLSYQSDLMREPWGFLDIAAEVHRRLVVLPVATFAEAVEIEVAEISFIEGIVVSRDRKGGIHVDLPTFHRDGRRLPTFCLPDELIEPVGRLVFEAYKEAVAPK
jgi:hypothetical protein